ncbi:MAG: AAA family ATPase [Mycoplasmataceae bacterium]|jgi:predicted ATP-dependent endonuclease of OLD family|nr:AAA family ATPase [Mycoplasmataceae bacterium]
MKLAEIKISGYKSIEDLTFPICKYGSIGSYTTILLGKNGSGKSNILDAMATPILAKNGKISKFDSLRNAQTEPKTINISFIFDLKNNSEYQEYISQTIEMPKYLLEDLKITRFIKKICLSSDNNSPYKFDYTFIYYKFPIENYWFAEMQKRQTTGHGQQPKIIEKVIIKAKSELTKEDGEHYSPLDVEQFNIIIKKALFKFANQVKTSIDVWKASPEYLIQDRIQLRDFANNMNNLPLKNMFYLAGQKTQEEIIQKITEIEKNYKQRKKLMRILSEKTTKYLNDKWKEQEIDVEVEIDSNLEMRVFVKDKCDKDNYFSMKERSQGFKQFVSLLLSLSMSNASGALKNHLILIDEPEIHLHPSGVRWMSRELLEIGKNNYVFISTHSPDMLDRNTRERHFLLEKGKDNLTKCRQIRTNEDLLDDEILKTAFGINVISDFLSPYKILVEGLTDKRLLLKALNQHNKNHGILITTGEGSSAPSVASMLSFHNIKPLIITDDDDTGRELKKKVLKIDDEFKDKTFTIRDLNGDIINGGTIEDTLPKAFVESKINKILEENQIEHIKLKDTSPFCNQLSIYLKQKILETTPNKKDKKRKIEDIITKVKTTISEYDEKAITENKAPKLCQLAKAILEKFDIKK